MPSGEVAAILVLAPPPAIAQNRFRDGAQHTEIQVVDTGRVLWVHVIPSGEVAAIAVAVPVPLTAQNRFSAGDQQTDDQ